jgi:hypothetical protein
MCGIELTKCLVLRPCLVKVIAAAASSGALEARLREPRSLNSTSSIIPPTSEATAAPASGETK